MNSLRFASLALFLVIVTAISVLLPSFSLTDPSSQQPHVLITAQRRTDSPVPLVRQAALPLYFESNRGQTDARVKFLSRGAGYILYLTGEGATISLHVPKAENAPLDKSPTSLVAQRDQHEFRLGHPSHPSPKAYATDSVQLKLVGANPSSPVTGDSPQSGKVNYFFGKDPSRWQTGITTYKGVRYANVYPGVDMLFHGSQQQLEYDFEVASGADPSSIALKVNGARDLHVDPHGDVVRATAYASSSFRCSHRIEYSRARSDSRRTRPRRHR